MLHLLQLHLVTASSVLADAERWEREYCKSIVPEYELMDSEARERMRRKQQGTTQPVDPHAVAKRTEDLKLKQRKRHVRQGRGMVGLTWCGGTIQHLVLCSIVVVGRLIHVLGGV